MSDIMRPISFGRLMNWVLKEYASQGTIFGVSRICKTNPAKTLPLFSEKIETPFGPAAGPNTQLAQNIITSYVGGSRFFELKTVQIMDGDELSACVNKPCIAARDECYNCEWSTELFVPQAYDEYVKAWYALKLISRELGLGGENGFVFNMSVGYDLEGIKSEKIDKYIEGMKNAENSYIWTQCRDWAIENIARFSGVDEAYVRSISPKVCDSITLSTLHGCPPHEIERIATYLIEEKKLNTYIKCNPTLLGYDFARKTMDSLGFDYMVFDDFHFNDDLQYSDAVPMFNRLLDLSASKGLDFGVKLTNTFPVAVGANELPSEEMYMSGRSLYPLTTELARRLCAQFGGKLRISYSGGADAYNIDKLFSAGIWPITIATTILKPGGYDRLDQLSDLISDVEFKTFDGVDFEKVCKIAADALTDSHYRKPIKPLPEHKMKNKVPLMDCFTAPCRGGCPIHQDIPAYVRLAGDGRYLEALRVITQRNPLPFITGTLCTHRCMDKCMRNHYDEAVGIRSTKLECAEKAFDMLLPELAPRPSNGKSVAIVGGGPGGLAAAYLLTQSGCDVTIFEAADKLGGIVRHVIPEFRIPSSAIDNDVKLVLSMGAKVVYNTKIGSAAELKEKGFEYIIFACGAQKAGDPRLEYGDYVPFSEVLAAHKGGEAVSLGKNVSVIGGGNSAMDTARLIKRLPGVENVRLVYRRTKRYMPADEEELADAIADGVEFMELLAPIGVRNGILTCKVMELGAPDASGRRAPQVTGKTVTIPTDTVVAAVGEKVDTSVDTSGENVFVIGDMKRGPATVVLAIADATEVAEAIIGTDVDKFAELNVAESDEMARFKRGRVVTDCNLVSEAYRCLECPTVCETCASVCPNRANFAVTVEGKRQIIHIDGMCNECGNCGVFCPYDSNPYKEKLSLFWSQADFDNSENEGFLRLEDLRVMLRLDAKVEELDLASGDCNLPHGIAETIRTVITKYPYVFA